MKNRHLTDLEIQEYAFDRSDCEASISEHIQACEVCTKRVGAYLFLATSLKDQQEPVLDYNLSALVIAQLPAEKSNQTSSDYLLPITVCFSISLMLLTLYLFKDALQNILSATLEPQRYFIMSTILFITMALVLDIISRFKKKMNLLDV